MQMLSTAPKLLPTKYIDATTEPMCTQFPDSQVILPDSEQPPNTSQPPSKYKTRQFDRMCKNIGAKARRIFFVNGTSGPVDFNEGIVCSVTSSNKYDIMYDDNDSEEMSEREFAHYSLPPKAQAHTHANANSHVLGGIIVDKNVRRAIVPKGTAIITPHFNPSDNKANVAKSGIRKSDTSESKLLYPSRVPQLIPEYYAACHFPETMPDVVETDNPIQGMLSNAAMLSSKKKAQRLSAYEPDPITVEDCLNSKN